MAATSALDNLILPMGGGATVALSLSRLIGSPPDSIRSRNISPPSQKPSARQNPMLAPGSPLGQALGTRLEGWCGERAKNGMLALPGQNAPSGEEKIYVSSAFNRLVEKGELSSELGPIVRKMYAEDMTEDSPTSIEKSVRLKGTWGWGCSSPRGGLESPVTPNSNRLMWSPRASNNRPMSAPSVRSSHAFDASRPSSLAASQSLQGKAVVCVESSSNRSSVSFVGYRRELILRPHTPAHLDSATPLSVYAVIKASRFAGALPDECVRTLASKSYFIDCIGRKALCFQGRRCDAAYVLAAGELVVYRHSPEKGKVSTPEARMLEAGRLRDIGDCVGEDSVLMGAAADSTVVCLARCRLVLISQRAMQTVVRSHPQVASLIAVNFPPHRRHDFFTSVEPACKRMVVFFWHRAT